MSTSSTTDARKPAPGDPPEPILHRPVAGNLEAGQCPPPTSRPVGSGGISGPHDPAPLLTIAQVCRRIPGARGAARLNPSTVTRWILTGCPGRAGARIQLPATRVGGRWLIAPDALDAFFAALAATAVAPSNPPPRTPPRREGDASARAARELERRGA